MDKQRQVETFNKHARAYDNRRKKQAQGTWRHRLLREASGEILELGVGAGANFPFYQSYERLTGVTGLVRTDSYPRLSESRNPSRAE